jgi:heptosyltransferase-2
MNIAVFWPNWIGDAVMATPAVRALRAFFPQAHFLNLLRPYVAGVLEGSPWLGDPGHRIVLDSKGPWANRWPAATKRLRRQRVDLAVIFPNTFRSALVAWLGGCRRRIGFARYGRGLLLTDRLHPRRDARGKRLPSPVIEDYNRLAEMAGCPPPGFRMELWTTADDETAAKVVWKQAGFAICPEVVCLNPGAAFGSAKHWPVEHFATLARSLVDRRGSGILILCGPNERDLANRIARETARPRVHSLADHPVSLGLTKACVRRSDLLITTDSGPRHFAAAFNVPVVSLFGPTHIVWTDTRYAREIQLQKKVDCGPCQLRVCPLDHRCMTQLSPEEVFAAAMELRSRFPRRNEHERRAG